MNRIIPLLQDAGCFGELSEHDKKMLIEDIGDIIDVETDFIYDMYCTT